MEILFIFCNGNCGTTEKRNGKAERIKYLGGVEV
jgi:hypothetical protein